MTSGTAAAILAPATIRFALLPGIALSLAMIGMQVFQYRPLLAMPGGFVFVAATMLVLLLHATVVVWVARSEAQITHLAAENLIHIQKPWEGVTSLAAMLITFLIWGVAGYRGARAARAVAPGVLAGCWSAIVTMSIVVPIGFVLEF